MASPRYETLGVGEIRLLTFGTISLESPDIDIRMSSTQLNETAEYLALSYVWGSGTDLRNITLNGRSMSVTANLYDALTCMRKRIAVASLGFPIRIWIDAICINQGDIPERNEQVRRMRDIYSLARVVWAFVGVETEHDQAGFQLIQALSTKFQGLSQTLNLGHPLPEDVGGTIANSLQHPSLELAWKAIGRLLTRPWWTRAWIVQEPSLIPVDYKLPVPQIWRQTVRAHLERYEDLDVLYLFSGSPAPLGFSSWAHECSARWAMSPAYLEVKNVGVEFVARTAL